MYIKPIQDFIVYLFSLDPSSELARAVAFFVYNSLKLTLLIFIIVTFTAFIRTYFPPSKIKKILAKSKFGQANVIASVLGAMTPFCSCSSIPLFLGFIKSGIPMGVAFSFLITSPLVNEVVFVMMLGTFGLKTAILYASFGIVLGVVLGIILEKLGLKKELEFKKNKDHDYDSHEKSFETLKDRLLFAAKDSYKMAKGILPFVILGMAIATLLNFYFPAELLAKYIGSGNWFAVPLAVLIGIPIYAGCSTIVPIAFAAVINGVPLGTALAFVMSVAGLSLPEALILKKVMSVKLLVIFFSLVGAGIVAAGFLFNLVA